MFVKSIDDRLNKVKIRNSDQTALTIVCTTIQEADGVNVLLWLPRSPDLNLIENVWDMMERKLGFALSSLDSGTVNL